MPQPRRLLHRRRRERCLISQEKFARNIINVSVKKDDDVYSHVCSVLSISDDPSKPRHRLDMRRVRPGIKYSNGHIVVDVPMVKCVPLFILMRALGILSDKSILEHA